MINENLEAINRSSGMAGEVGLEYDHPVNVPQHFSAVCKKTTQNNSHLQIINQSATFELTVYIDPAPESGGATQTRAANDRTPINIVQNYAGAVLNVANISQEAASAQVQLNDLA